MEWLREHVPVRLPAERLAHRLTLAGLEVTEIEQADGQPVLVLEITPNRPDCLSMLGIAREVAAITGRRLKPHTEEARPSRTVRARSPRIRIEDRAGCSRYIGRVLDGVRVGPSPEWMQRRLAACGVRAINNVVDATNYVLLDRGQPLHAFDLDRLAQETIVVRAARPNEAVTTLDGVRRILPLGTLVIADAERPVAIAGVMGGAESAVTDRTTRILLESAGFDPLRVRRTARALGLASESSYRFERGVDPEGIEPASAAAASLIGTLAGGSVTGMRDAGRPPSKRTVISFNVAHANRRLGIRWSPTEVRTTLARIFCRVASSGTSEALQVTVPSFRRDLTQAVDLEEEMARLFGYDRLPETIPHAAIAPAVDPATSSRVAATRRLRELCAAAGLMEVMPWALVSAAELSACRESVDDAVRLANPLSQDHAYLRPSLRVGLLRVAKRNLSQGVANLRMFELGNVVRRSGGSIAESLRLGLAVSGLWSRTWRAQAPADLFQLKGLLQVMTDRMGAGAIQIAPASLSWAEPGQAGTLLLDQRPAGVIGQVARPVLEALGLDQPIWLAELDPEGLFQARHLHASLRPPSPFPPVKRDLSVLVPDAVKFSDVLAILHEPQEAMTVTAQLADRYAGDRVPRGSYSLTVSLSYAHAERTLTATEVDAVHQRLIRALMDRLDAQLR